MDMVSGVAVDRSPQWIRIDTEPLVSGALYEIQSRCRARSFLFFGETPDDAKCEVLHPLQRFPFVSDGTPIWGKCDAAPGIFTITSRGTPPALESTLQSVLAALQGKQRTVTYTSATGAGQTPANCVQFSIANVGTLPALVGGQPLPAGATTDQRANLGDRFAPVSYDGTGTKLLIQVTQ